MILFVNKLDIATTESERKLIRRLASSSELDIDDFLPVVLLPLPRRPVHSCHAGADGSVFNKYPLLKARGAQALKEIFDWEM